MNVDQFHFELGLRVEDASKNGAPAEFVSRLRSLVNADRKRTGRSLFGFGWHWWKQHWTLDAETECIEVYTKTRSIRKTAERLGVHYCEVSYLLDSVGKLFPEHQHRYRGAKIFTWHRSRLCVKLRRKGVTCNQIALRIGATRFTVLKVLASLGYETEDTVISDEQKLRIKRLYAKGIVPKKMKEHGVKASWPSIYKWLKAEGLIKRIHIRNNTRGELRELYLKSNFTETRWHAFSTLTRRLTNDTYRKHQQTIDPEKKRGIHWHLDHKVSVYKAFLLNWTPEQAAALSNLQILPALDNHRKFTGELNG